MKTEGLKQALDKHGFDAAFGGARRLDFSKFKRWMALLQPTSIRSEQYFPVGVALLGLMFNPCSGPRLYHPVREVWEYQSGAKRGIPSFLVQREESLNDNYPTAGSKGEGCRR
jgi:hypothetical protein